MAVLTNPCRLLTIPIFRVRFGTLVIEQTAETCAGSFSRSGCWQNRPTTKTDVNVVRNLLLALLLALFLALFMAVFFSSIGKLNDLGGVFCTIVYLDSMKGNHILGSNLDHSVRETMAGSTPSAWVCWFLCVQVQAMHRCCWPQIGHIFWAQTKASAALSEATCCIICCFLYLTFWE